MHADVDVELGAIELHTPMWRHPAIGKPDMIVFERVDVIGDLCAALDDARAKPAALPAG